MEKAGYAINILQQGTCVYWPI